jgi:uncharacterized protein (TIGR02246 family)
MVEVAGVSVKLVNTSCGPVGGPLPPPQASVAMMTTTPAEKRDVANGYLLWRWWHGSGPSEAIVSAAEPPRNVPESTCTGRRPEQIRSMPTLLTVLSVPAALCTTAPATPAPLTPDSLGIVYETGRTWEAFLAGVSARRAIWTHNWTEGRVPEDLLARARATGGPWRILAITEDGCSDSVHTIPYLAKLVEATPGLELRVVNSATGRPWMEAHRSLDGRPSTPTVLVLDQHYQILGCWVEQPVALQPLWLPVVARGTMSQEVGDKMAWYEREAGRETLREFVEVLEGAQSGQVICPGLPGSTTRDRDVVAGLARSIGEAFSDGDEARFLSLLAADAVWMPPDAPAVTGRDAIADWFRRSQTRTSQALTFRPVDVRIHGDWAIMQTVVTGAVTPRDGGVAVPVNNTAFFVLVRQPDNSWLFWRDIWNRNH